MIHPLYAQDGELQGERDKLSNMFIYGGHVSSTGFGGNLQYIRGSEGNRLSFGLSVFSLKHPKETRIRPVRRDDGGRFIFDKINYCYLVNPQVGLHRQILSLSSFNLLRVDAGIYIGPTLSLLRPYKLRVVKPLSSNPRVGQVVSEQYNPDEHSYTDILGVSNFFEGEFDFDMMPGVSIGSYTDLNFSSSKNYIRSLRLGIKCDIFTKEVPLMGDAENKKVFLGFSAGIMMGRKW